MMDLKAFRSLRYAFGVWEKKVFSLNVSCILKSIDLIMSLQSLILDSLFARFSISMLLFLLFVILIQIFDCIIDTLRMILLIFLAVEMVLPGRMYCC